MVEPPSLRKSNPHLQDSTDISDVIGQNRAQGQIKFENSYVAKVVVLGKYSVGKSSILLSLDGSRSIDEVPASTSGHLTLYHAVRENDSITLQIWDTAGTEQFKAVTRLYYKRAAGAILVYDSSDPSSFSDLVQWRQDFLDNASPDCIVIAANKIDIAPRSFSQTITAAMDFAEKNDHPFFLTSAKTGLNITAIFDTLVDRLYSNLKKRQAESGPSIAISPSESVSAGLPACGC